MRIKMQCPDCGKWFTLELSVKEQIAGRMSGTHADSEAAGGPRSERAPTASTPTASAPTRGRGDRPPATSSAWPLRVAPVVIVAALVLAWFFLIAPALERSRTGIVSETNAAAPSEPFAGPAGEAAAVEPPPSEGAVEAAAEETAVEPPPAEEAAGAAGEPSEGAPPPAGDVPEAEAVVGSAPLEFVLVATDRCWVRVVTDGRVVSDVTLEAGERRAWRADSSIELSAGSGEDVEVHLNGEFLGTAGPGARVVEGLVITADGFVVRS
ncbi:MAG: RodZ domain-containing protein [Candidatus Eisenbacteria bacterium]